MIGLSKKIDKHSIIPMIAPNSGGYSELSNSSDYDMIG